MPADSLIDKALGILPILAERNLLQLGDRVRSGGGLSHAGPEGNNLVVDVMSDVGASQPWNPGPLAPVTGDLFFVHAETRFVRGHIAATAKHHARHPPDFDVTRNVK